MSQRIENKEFAILNHALFGEIKVEVIKRHVDGQVVTIKYIYHPNVPASGIGNTRAVFSNRLRPI